MASQVGKTIVGGIDLNKARRRAVLEAMIALSASPNGFIGWRMEALRRQMQEVQAMERAIAAVNRPGIGGDRFDQITQPWGVGP